MIDLKVGKLAHGDLGQMLLYVNYYDREVAAKDDSPTIGLILCSEKNDAVVRYVLAEKNNQVFASRYQLHLPSEDDLRTEMRRELDRLGHDVAEVRAESPAEPKVRKTVRASRTEPKRNAGKKP